MIDNSVAFACPSLTFWSARSIAENAENAERSQITTWRAAAVIVPSWSEVVQKEGTEVRHLRRRKGLLQHIYDFVGAPLRMVVLPDAWSNRLRFTSLEDERLRAVLGVLEGHTLDVGAGANRLIGLWEDGVGVDVVDWDGGATVVQDTRELPFSDGTFDSVAFVACLNHIPYREDALREAKRVLKPGGLIVVTMIGRIIGGVGHKLWWYSEDKHREVAEGELMGMSPQHVERLLREAGFCDLGHRRFLYMLNHLFTARKRTSGGPPA